MSDQQQTTPTADRKIIHIDMDAFYAAVEQRDNPSLRGKPVIVGGSPDKRGVVATCSYEARKFGIHSAMASSRAAQLCPSAIFVRPRFEAYQDVSNQIREIFFEYTDLVEPLSLDEAYLDVTENKKEMPSATIIAREIRAAIRERTQLTASAGVSYNKFLAKIGSDYKKPDGLTVILPAQALEFIGALSIRKFFGVGKATEKKMTTLGIKTGADLLKFTMEELVRNFGKGGGYFFHIARGRDDRLVVPERVRKSLGKEVTLEEDTGDKEQVLTILKALAERVSGLLKQQELEGYTITLKVKYSDFTSITRSHSADYPFIEQSRLFNHAVQLLDKTEVGKRCIRLLGITVSNFSGENPENVDTDQLFLPFSN